MVIFSKIYSNDSRSRSSKGNSKKLKNINFISLSLSKINLLLEYR